MTTAAIPREDMQPLEAEEPLARPTPDPSADRARVNLLLDLLGATLAELQSPAHALAWSAALSDADLLRVPDDLRDGLREVRAASQRLVDLFHRIQEDAARTGAGERRRDGLARIRLVACAATPELAARLQDSLASQGVRCLLRLAHGREGLLRAVRSRDVDAVLLPSGVPPGQARDLTLLVQRERPGMPVFHLNEAEVAALGRGLADAVASYRRNERAGSAWRWIEEVALRDPLTGALNRRAFERYARTEFMRSRRYGYPLALALFDLDYFKQVNDRLGHLAGDRALQAVATALQAGARESDFVARLGGDEFVVLMTHTDGAGGFAVTERLREAGDRVLRQCLPAIEPFPALSAGLAIYPSEHTRSFDELVQRADEELYRVKALRHRQP